MEYILSFISVLAVIFVWTKVLKKSLLDNSRDRLFDLRDSAREWFLKKDISLDDRVYLSLRGTLNAHIRHTHDLSLTRYLVVSVMLEQDGEYKNKLCKALDRSFKTDDIEVSNYVNTVRLKAYHAVLEYMVASSFFVFSVMLIVSPMILIVLSIRALFKFLRDNRFVALGIKKTTAFAAVFTIMVSCLPCQAITSTPGVARYFNQQRIEGYSLR